MSLPKPYYQDKWVTIYHGDCRDILPHLPKVDLVITDPPYIWNKTTGGIVQTKLSGQWGYGGMLKQADVTAGIRQIKFSEWLNLCVSLMSDNCDIYIFK